MALARTDTPEAPLTPSSSPSKPQFRPKSAASKPILAMLSDGILLRITSVQDECTLHRV